MHIGDEPQRAASGDHDSPPPARRKSVAPRNGRGRVQHQQACGAKQWQALRDAVGCGADSQIEPATELRRISQGEGSPTSLREHCESDAKRQPDGLPASLPPAPFSKIFFNLRAGLHPSIIIL